MEKNKISVYSFLLLFTLLSKSLFAGGGTEDGLSCETAYLPNITQLEEYNFAEEE